MRNTNKNRKAMAKKATPVPNNLNVSLWARVKTHESYRSLALASRPAIT